MSLKDVATSYRGTTFSERMAGAPCLEEDPELSYPVTTTEGKRGRGPGAAARYATAKKICAGCPVPIKEECLDVAMRTEGNASGASRHGVFGGLDPDQRASLARARARGKAGQD